ncbi:MspA family porin [Nocardia anaemiae]|uniref:MspA family porin n=1 Tax=Nocardia anaemiae TaxID=263910 RepID=UPI0014717A8D|nr:MspA family porin [Nocardia anaemiae]
MRRSVGAAIMTCAFLPLALTTSVAAQADTSIPLTDGHDRFSTRDGLVVAVDRTGEYATISGSMAASPLSRNAWVSGVTSVHIIVPADITVTGGQIETGYLVGCQVDLGTGTSGITQYVDHTLSVEGCAGAAEARAYTTVTVHDNVMDDSETLWGQPFSLG